jgi:hypothetical protein
MQIPSKATTLFEKKAKKHLGIMTQFFDGFTRGEGESLSKKE